MKRTIINSICCLMLVLTCMGVKAQEGVHLSTYFSHANHDTSPSSSHVDRYSIYLTEKGEQNLSDIQSAVLADASAVNNYTYICHPKFWNTECSQYATLDMTEDADDSSLLDGRYEPTANTLAIVVYEHQGHREVLVMPGADEYFYEFFDDFEQPGTGWGEGGEDPQVGIASSERPSIVAFGENRNVVVKGAQGCLVELYDIEGRKLCSRTANSDRTEMAVASNGVYLVRVDGRSAKVLVW